MSFIGGGGVSEWFQGMPGGRCQDTLEGCFRQETRQALEFLTFPPACLQSSGDSEGLMGQARRPWGGGGYAQPWE